MDCDSAMNIYIEIMILLSARLLGRFGTMLPPVPRGIVLNQCYLVRFSLDQVLSWINLKIKISHKNNMLAASCLGAFFLINH